MVIQLVHDDLENLQKRKGNLKYRSLVDAHDPLMLNLYAGVQFRDLVPDWKRRIVIDTPPSRRRARSRGRVSFWEIDFSCVAERRTTVHLCHRLIGSSSKKLKGSVRLYIESSLDTEIELTLQKHSIQGIMFCDCSTVVERALRLSVICTLILSGLSV